MCVLMKPTGSDMKSTVELISHVAFLLSRFTAFSPLVRSHCFISYNVAFCVVCVFQDSTLCPSIQQPTTTLSSSTVPAGHW